MSESHSDGNPLLDESDLPRFAEILAEHVEPGMRALLTELEAELDALERSVEPSWSGAVEPLERISDRLGTRWGIVGHLIGVKNDPALRAAHEAVQPEVVRFGIRLAQSRPLYEAFLALQKSGARAGLDPAQRRIVDVLVRDALLSGVGLEGAAKERFNAILTELAELQTTFSNHVLDATKAYSLVLRERDAVAGLPESALDLAAQSAREAGEAGATAEHGPWRLTLDGPSIIPALQHLRRRDLREPLYRAHITRASSGETDNAPLISRILALRAEEAALLGFASFAELSLATKMAPDVPAVEKLQEELRRASFAAAQRELEELCEFARARPE